LLPEINSKRLFPASEVEGRVMIETELLTVSQLAERLHVRPRTVQSWARQGRIPTVKLSSKVVRFDWQAVLTVIRDRSTRQEVAHA
jgi:excisionase family DNA binding protein